jgi:hypothetical protein
MQYVWKRSLFDLRILGRVAKGNDGYELPVIRRSKSLRHDWGI